MNVLDLNYISNIIYLFVTVIDFCLTKNLVVDPMSKFSSLQLEWASHVNCEQRAGRVGRVSNGRIYRLVTREFYEVKYIVLVTNWTKLIENF